MCKSAIESAALNVYVNTMSMKDRDYAEALNNEVKKMSDQYVVIASEVYKSVMRRLR